MITQSAAAMSEALSKGEVTSTELTQAHLDRIASVDSSVKAFLHVDAEGALAQAARVDADRSAGKKLHPLAGIPLALKDVLTQEGIPTTAGSKILQGWKPQYDSTVVSKIKEYFKKRLTNEFIENSTEMYSVSEDSTISYLEVFSENLVEPVESKRRLLRSIYFTPNNPDSSRSILIYTFAFKTDNKYTVLTIIDFPGKEDPIPTYIYDESTRSVDDFVLKITSGYSLPGLNYNEPYIRTTLQRFSNDPNIKIDTFFNILPFIPLVLLTIDYKTNIAIIEELNKYLDKTKSSNSALSTQINEEIKNILDNILNEKIIQLINKIKK